MLEKTKEIIHNEIPSEFQESALKAVKLATDSIISKIKFITANENQKFGQRLEQKAAEAEAKVDDTSNMAESESARREAQAYRSTQDEIIETLKAIDKEISKVRRSITRESKPNLPKK